MPTSDGRVGHRDLCTSAVVERTIGPASVSSLKIAASLQSDNFSSGSAGWKIERATGSAEFQDVIVRGTLNADDITTGTLAAARIAADSLTVDKLAAGTIGTHVLKLSNAAGSRIESNDGTSMVIRGDGSAVFTNVTVTGVVNATTGMLTTLSIDGTLTMITNGVIKTAGSGARIEIQNLTAVTGRIRFFNAAGSESFIQEGGLDDISIVANGLAQLHVRGTVGDPHIRTGTDTRYRAGDGTGAKPIYSFGNDTDTGIIRAGSNEIGFVVGGILAGKVDSTESWQLGRAVTGNADIQDAAGDAAFPTYSYQGDTDTGAYRVGVNQWGVSVGGAARLTIDTIQIRATGSAHFVDTAPGATGTIDAQWINSGGAVRTLSEVTSMLSKKQDITPLEEFLDTSKVLDLDLIAFHMKEDPDGPWHIGTVAASVGKHLPALAYKRDGKWDFGSYSRLVIPLIAEVRKLRDRVDILEAAA